jgi:hypothetical protein
MHWKAECFSLEWQGMPVLVPQASWVLAAILYSSLVHLSKLFFLIMHIIPHILNSVNYMLHLDP